MDWIGVALALVGIGIALLPLADQFNFLKAYAVPGGVALILAGLLLCLVPIWKRIQARREAKPRSCAAPAPIRSPTTTSPLAMPSRTAKGWGASRCAATSDHREPRPDRTLGVVLMCLRIAERCRRPCICRQTPRSGRPCRRRRDDRCRQFRADPRGRSAPRARSSRRDGRRSRSAGGSASATAKLAGAAGDPVVAARAHHSADRRSPLTAAGNGRLRRPQAL